MAYYLRVLSKQRRAVPISAIEQALQVEGVRTGVAVEDDSEEWQSLVLTHPDGREFAVVERNVCTPGELGADEIEEFVDEVPSFGPATAASWLVDYLPRIQAVYAIQVLSLADEGDGWKAIHAVQSALWNAGGGILQADGEGFTNEDGHHILWQFSDSVTGSWSMAVLNEDGSWTAFEMDLGDIEHRRAFLQGRVPAGVRRS